MSLTWSLEEYLDVVRMEKPRHLLVEGPSDKDLFVKLLRDHWNQPSNKEIIIDSAESLHGYGFEGTGENREKVEWVCSAISGRPYAQRLVGFTDREFRDFGLDPNIVDELQRHKVMDRLVWSRGHSIENYFFEPDILVDALWQMEITHPDIAELDRLRDSIPSLLRQGCAIGLAGWDCKRLQKVRTTIEPSVFRENHLDVRICTDRWSELLTHRSWNPDQVEFIVERFSFWESRLELAEDSVVRWLCDGHIGLQIVWAAYEFLLERRSGAPGRLNRDKDGRFRACTATWCKQTTAIRQDSYPLEVFELLELVKHKQDEPN
jgi:hypothetical protein